MKKTIPVAAVFVIVLAACSSTSTPAANTGGTNATISNCTAFVDHTADAEVMLTWDFPIAQADDRCSKIKVGSKVKWSGNFSTHPLFPAGGDKPNPITSNGMAGMGDAEIAFPTAGTFGFICGMHTQMTGAIEVVP